VASKRDQQFFDAFMIVVGIFVGIIVAVAFLADFVGDEATESGEAQSAVEERIRPLGRVALVGDATLAAAPMASVSAVPVAAPLSGAQVYNEICQLCHAAPGVGGAPSLGDAAAWAPRIEQGSQILEDHVLNGYQGQAGFMPPKGGRMDLSDAEVLAAMNFMLEAAE
jgi:cytochrome c5